MSKRPNLELPQRPPRARSGAAGGLTLALILIVVVLQVLSLLRLPRETPVQWTTGGHLLSAEDHKELAIRLEDKNLPEAAAEAWAAYFREADLTGTEAARVLLQIGKLKQESGDYAGAIHEYYLAERLLEREGAEDEELSRTITMRVRECFRKLGQYADLAREMAERSSPTPQDVSLAGRQVVAEIEGEKITVAEFDRRVQDEIELMVKSQWGLTPEEADAFRQRAHGRLMDPQAKARQLEQMVVTLVLAKEARRQGVDESPTFRERIVATADSMLADTLIAMEISKRATVTRQDVERFFEANKDRYAEPATTSIAHIVCAMQEEAAEIIRRVQAGEDFAELAREHSLDEETRDEGGLLPRPIPEGAHVVPGIAREAELHQRIMETPPGSIVDEPYRSDKGWEVIKIIDRTQRVEKTLDQVWDRVEYDTRLARRREVSGQYIGQLLEAAGVRMYPEVFSKPPTDPNDDSK